MQKIYIEKSTNKVSQIIKDYYEDFETENISGVQARMDNITIQ